MPKIGKEKTKKIKEQILHYLYEQSPKAIFTAHIAKEIARDEEFIKRLMEELYRSRFVVLVNKNTLGGEYLLRKKWRISPNIYSAYSKLI